MKLKKWFVFLLAMVLIFSGLPIGVAAANQDIMIQSFEALKPLDSKIEDEIIVIYQNQGSVKDLTLTTNQIEAGEQLNERVDLLKVSHSEDLDSLVLALSKNPHVLVAEKNSTVQTFAMPNDPKLDLAWQFERVGADKTWDSIDNEEAVVVAVIDSGLNTKHPDILGKTVEGYDYIAESKDVIDVAGHGTAVSGCIAAIANNGIGMAGVGGSANIKIAPFRVGGTVENGSELNTGYICAALYEAANRPDIQVVNMSFGAYGTSPAMRAAIDYAAKMDKVLVAASGNEGSNADYAGEFSFPSSYNNVISVGATDIHNEITCFSQFNPMVDLCAPGKDIYTTTFKGDYTTVSGTSFASPITAGACAVLLAADPTLTPLQVEDILKETAIDFSQKGRDDHYGQGMIQLDKALAKVKPSVIQSYHQVKKLDRDAKIDDEIVIIYQNEGSVKDLALTTNQVEAGAILNDQVDIIKLGNANQVDALVTELLKNPFVLAAERNSHLKLSALPNDPFLDQEWYFEAIGADQTWDQVNNEKTVVVAVLDTGLNLEHPDIAENTVAGYDFIEDKTETIDLVGHGTAVSGCIAAVTNNEIGIAGVAGSADIKIAPYRIGGETEDDLEVNLGYVCAALYHAANRPEVKVINMSFGEYEASSILETAINYAAKAGKILVASSGNEGDDPKTAGKTAIPSAYNHVISVGATDQDNMIADFSQYNDSVDLCAPGVETLTLGKDDDYISPSGTSFSSPIVAGAAAVLVANDETLSASEVETLLKETALDLGGQGRDEYYGYGLIQLDAALAKVTSKDPLRISYFGADKLSGQKIGTAIVLDALANGGSGDYSYAFYYELNGETTMIQDFSEEDQASFTPSRPGIYKFKVEVKNNENTAKSELINYWIKDPMIMVNYRTHVQNEGWQDFVESGAVSGTEGKSLRLEAIEVSANSIDYDLGLEYKTHVENEGWQDFVADGALSGTEGKALRLEAVEMKLTGADAERFDIYYQVHAQNRGWLDWAKNGDPAGTEGFGYRLEGIKIQVVLKGSDAPGKMAKPFVKQESS